MFFITLVYFLHVWARISTFNHSISFPSQITLFLSIGKLLGGACGKSIPGLKTQSERKEEKKEKKIIIKV